jgi:alanine racemase
MSFRPTQVHIEREVLKQNLRLLQQWNGAQAFFCPMVKANAYGHGDVLVAKCVEEVGASAMGVALIEEGIRLRQAGIRLPILVFAPLTSVAAAKAAVEQQITPVLGRFEDVEFLREALAGRSYAVHLKFNTGMNRLGFDRDEVQKLRDLLPSHLRVEGVCTHLSHGDEIYVADGISRQQIARLGEMAHEFPGVRHAHKSASLATLVRHQLPKDPELGTRPGISIYGIPYDGELSAPGLQPCLRWKTRVLRIHQVQKGEAVSYGARWVAARRSTIGVLPVGYGDGYMRALSNRGEMLCRGQRVPVVGSVCMDYTLIDLTDAPAAVDDEVVLLGAQGTQRITAQELAEKAGTIAYEIVTGISARVVREGE